MWVVGLGTWIMVLSPLGMYLCNGPIHTLGPLDILERVWYNIVMVTETNAQTETLNTITQHQHMRRFMAALNLTHPHKEYHEFITDYNDPENIKNGLIEAYEYERTRNAYLMGACNYIAFATEVPKSYAHGTEFRAYVQTYEPKEGSRNRPGVADIEITFSQFATCGAVYRDGQWSFHS